MDEVSGAAYGGHASKLATAPQEFSLRAATPADAAAFAVLHGMATDGVAKYVWSKHGDPACSPLQVGESRFAASDGRLSHRNATVATFGGQVAGLLLAAPAAANSHAEPDPVLRPYAELTAPGSYYVASLAVMPSFQGRGLGGRLLATAREQAFALGFERLSLLCAEENTPALRLYQRFGFREAARRRIAPNPSLRRKGDILLMVAPSRGVDSDSHVSESEIRS